MKTVTITGIMADFLDSIRAYEHESGSAITFDERESSEFVDMYFNGEGKLKIEEEKPLLEIKEMTLKRIKEIQEQRAKKKKEMRYIIIDGLEVFKMEWYDYGTHFVEGVVIVDMLEQEFTVDGVKWLAISEFEF